MKRFCWSWAIGLVAVNTVYATVLTSPRGDVRLLLSNRDNLPLFAVQYRGDTILRPSRLGLDVNGTDLAARTTRLLITQTRFDQTWEPVNGKNRSIRNHYRGYWIECETAMEDKLVYALEFRLYDSGLAYRYHIQATGPGGVMNTVQETSRFTLPGDYTYWAYNAERHPLGPIQRSQTSKTSVRFPMVIRLAADRYLALSEAEIVTYAPFSINAASQDCALGLNATYSPKSESFQSSWRAFLFGDCPGDLVESDLLVNLNPPCQIADPSWIKPGKSLWDWRVWGYQTDDGFTYGLNTVSHKRMIDFAAAHNIQYLLIDADWYGAEFSAESDPTTAREGIVIEECMAYARDMGVGVILYLNDVGAKKFGLERVLKQFADWGAKGVKYGFMRGSAPEKVKHTRKVVELCAKYKLMVDFHDGPIPPSGDRRTWPNLVTKEYCHAQADAKRSHGPETPVNTALVNMIAGPLDMTNGWFDLNHSEVRPKVFEVIPGTVAAEVAKLIVIYTGLMVLPDAPEAYLKKQDLFDCIRKMPDQFDSFQVLDSKLDEYIVVARRAGDDWFVGMLTNRQPRQLSVDCSFLEPGKEYQVTVYEDAPESHYQTNKESYQVRTHKCTKDTTITVALAPGGGCSLFISEL